MGEVEIKTNFDVALVSWEMLCATKNWILDSSLHNKMQFFLTDWQIC